MEVSIFLAKVLGLYLVIACLAVLVNRKTSDKIIKEFAKDTKTVFFSGLLALLIGLMLVVSHNIWVKDWRVIITIFGWGALIKGVARTFMPEKAMNLGLKVYEYIAPVLFIICLAAGAYLAYMGFTA